MPIEDMVEIEGFDADVADQLRQRARAYLAKRDEEFSKQRRDLGVTDELANLADITPPMMVALGENGVKTLDDLADLASDELIEIVPPGPLARIRPTKSLWPRAPIGSRTRTRPRTPRPPTAKRGVARTKPPNRQRRNREVAARMSRHGKNEAVEGEDMRRCLVTGDRLPTEGLLRLSSPPTAPWWRTWMAACRDGVVVEVAARYGKSGLRRELVCQGLGGTRHGGRRLGRAGGGPFDAPLPRPDRAGAARRAGGDRV